MIQKRSWKNAIPGFLVALVVILLGVAGYNFMGEASFVRTALSGLTLGALYFMVAAGLTIIFGLMDVLNFAHGAMFMTGAYIGWQFYANPTFLFGLLPLILAFVTGLTTTSLWLPYVIKWNLTEVWQTRIRTIFIVAGLGLVVIGFWKLDILGLAQTAMVAAMTAANPLAEATPQEALSIFWYRPALVMLGGIFLAVASARPGDKTQIIHTDQPALKWIRLGILIVLTLIASIYREDASIAVLKMNGDLRFILALMVGMGAGAGLGAVVEISLIRPLYARPFYIILVTSGIGYVLRRLSNSYGPRLRMPWKDHPRFPTRQGRKHFCLV